MEGHTEDAARLVSLSTLLKNFDSWTEHVNRIIQHEKELQAELEVMNKHKEHLKEVETNTNQEMKRMNEFVDMLQSSLNTKCDLEDKNVQLVKILESKDTEIRTQKQCHTNRIKELEHLIEETELQHEAKLAEIRNELQEKGREQKEALERVVASEQELNAQLRREMEQQSKDHETNTLKLRMEYDAKLLMQQKQNAKMQKSVSSTSTSGQDIFRKKLQHVKSQSDAEIAGLKRKIQELQNKLDTKSLASQQTATPLSKRKRY